MRTVVVITGASGSVFGVELLARLPGERFVIVTKWGKMVLREETGLTVQDLESRADGVFSDEDLSPYFAEIVPEGEGKA